MYQRYYCIAWRKCFDGLNPHGFGLKISNFLPFEALCMHTHHTTAPATCKGYVTFRTECSGHSGSSVRRSSSEKTALEATVATLLWMGWFWYSPLYLTFQIIHKKSLFQRFWILTAFLKLKWYSSYSTGFRQKKPRLKFPLSPCTGHFPSAINSHVSSADKLGRKINPFEHSTS